MVALGIDFGSRTLRLAISALNDSQPVGELHYLGAININEILGVYHNYFRGSSLKALLDESAIPYTRGKPLPLVQLTTEILKQIYQRLEHKYQAPITHCAITVPCGYGARGRQQLQEAARLAGFTRMRLLLEPMAVLFSRKNDSVEKLKLVCSWGENRCNILVARVKGSWIEEISSRGETGLSGTRLLDTVRQQLRSIHHVRTGQDPELTQEIVDMQNLAAQRTLEVLSAQEEVEIPLFARPARGFGTIRIHRAQLLSWIQGDLTRCIEVCDSVIQKGGIASPQVIDEVWLAGGITSIPKLRELFSAWWGREPLIAQAESAALGAAYFAETLQATPNNDIPNRELLPEQPATGVEQVSLTETPSPDAPAHAVETSPQVQTAPANEHQNEKLTQKEAELLGLLREVEQDLAAGELAKATQAAQNALEVINTYRARILFAEGIQYLKDARQKLVENEHEANPRLKKNLSSRVNELLTLASSKVQEALRLDYKQDAYHQAATEIEQLLKERKVEDIYLSAIKEREENNFPRAIKYFQEILRLDPGNTYCREQYAKTLLEYLLLKKRDYDRKVLRQADKASAKDEMRTLIYKVRELYPPESPEMRLILRIEDDLRHNLKSPF